MFWLLTLPFRILFGLLVGLLFLPFALLLVPFFLLRFAVRSMFALLLLPILLVVAILVVVFGVVAFSLALVAPLLPILAIGFVVWAVARMASRPRLAT